METRIWVLSLLLATSACGGGQDVTFGNGNTGGESGSETGGSSTGGVIEAGGSAGGTPDGGGGTGGDPVGGAGGEAGMGGAAGQGGQGGAPICAPGTTQCSGLDVETCNQDGSAWATTSTCPFVCSAGACTGVCSPSSTKCDGLTPQTCNNQGQWDNGSPCPFVCTAGACTGSCTPNAVQCNGNTVQTCNGQGTWDNTQLCPYVCSNGACTGVCVPGATQCSGDTVQTCSGQGQWTSGSPCPFVCQAGACTGVCVPGSKKCSGSSTQTCNVNGQWAAPVACPTGPNENPTCSAGVCGTTCQAGFDDCTNAPGCESDLSNPATCGSCNNTCDSTGGTPTCTNGTCGIICDSQHADCTNAPGCETPLGTTSDCLSCGDSCAAPANAVGVCTPSGCDFACTGLWDDCANGASDGCEKDVSSDPWNCGGCGISCYGGTCTNGACNEGVTKVADALDVTSLALGASEVYWTEGSGNIEKAPSAGGQAVLLASGESIPQAAVTDGVNVIWSNVGTNIRKVPVSGGPTTTLVAGQGPLELTHDGVDLWWTDQTSYTPCFCSTTTWTQVWKAPLSGGPAVLFNAVNPNVTQAWGSWPGLAVNSTRVFRARWMSAPAYSDVFYHEKANPSSTSTLVSIVDGQGFNAADHLVISPNGFNLAWRGGVSWNWIYTVLENGSGGDVVAAMNGTVVDLVIDDTSVYYIWASNAGAQARRKIYRKGLGDGAVPGQGTLLVDNQFKADHIKVDGAHIYWYTEGYKFDDLNPAVPNVAETAILRAPK